MKILKYILSLFSYNNKIYWVFRKFEKSECYENITDSEVIIHNFAIHFVDPFKSKKEAKKAIDFAKQLQPWQEFVILVGC